MIDSDSSFLSRKSFDEVDQIIENRPFLIVPLGGCEPFGCGAALGAESICCGELAHILSRRLDISSAPLLPFGCSVPFMSFGGSCGMRPRTLINLMLELLHCYIFQGFRNVFVINTVPFNREPLEEVKTRISKKYKDVKIGVFDLNSDSRLRKFTGMDQAESVFDRNERLFLSVLSHLAPELLEGRRGKNTGAASEKEYAKWRRRGRDPQKYRSLFPEGLVSTDMGNFDPQQGKVLFEFVLDTAQTDIQKLFDLDESKTSNA